MEVKQNTPDTVLLTVAESEWLQNYWEFPSDIRQRAFVARLAVAGRFMPADEFATLARHHPLVDTCDGVNDHLALYAVETAVETVNVGQVLDRQGHYSDNTPRPIIEMELTDQEKLLVLRGALDSYRHAKRIVNDPLEVAQEGKEHIRFLTIVQDGDEETRDKVIAGLDSGDMDTLDEETIEKNRRLMPVLGHLIADITYYFEGHSGPESSSP